MGEEVIFTPTKSIKGNIFFTSKRNFSARLAENLLNWPFSEWAQSLSSYSLTTFNIFSPSRLKAFCQAWRLVR